MHAILIGYPLSPRDEMERTAQRQPGDEFGQFRVELSRQDSEGDLLSQLLGGTMPLFHFV
jgi:hypothetical protein